MRGWKPYSIRKLQTLTTGHRSLVVVALVLRPLRFPLRSVSRQNAVEMRDLQLAATSYAALNRELHVYGVASAAVADLGESSAAGARTFGRMRTLQRLVLSRRIDDQALVAGRREERRVRGAEVVRRA